MAFKQAMGQDITHSMDEQVAVEMPNCCSGTDVILTAGRQHLESQSTSLPLHQLLVITTVSKFTQYSGPVS